MNYVSNRNYGCRITEIMIKGCRSLIVENNFLYILILLDKGADIVSFTYKKTDTDVLWRSPSGFDLLNQNLSNEAKYVGGWFECFPNSGEACNLQPGIVPQYGDVKFSPWEYSVLRDDENCVSVRLFVRSNALPFSLEKTLTLKINESVLDVKEMATNFSKHESPLTWGHHPNIGAPFLNENCVITVPEGELWFKFCDSDKSIREVLVGTWPFFEYNNKIWDLSKIPNHDDELNAIIYMKNIKGNRASVRDTKTGVEFFIEWDSSIFKELSLWYAFQNNHWNSMFGYHQIVNFFFNSSGYGSVKTCMDNGTHISVAAGESVSTWYKTGITQKQEA